MSDKEFIMQLYDDYFKLVRKTIYKIIQNPTDLDDLINDTFLKLIEKISLLRDFSCHKMTAYVVYTSKSIAINYIKHRDVVNKHIYYGMENDLSEVMEDIFDCLEDQILHRLDIEGLRDIILRLPESQKDILVFKYFLEMPDAEIAKTIGISPKSVPQYVKRARNAAKKLFSKEACI